MLLTVVTRGSLATHSIVLLASDQGFADNSYIELFSENNKSIVAKVILTDRIDKGKIEICSNHAMILDKCGGEDVLARSVELSVIDELIVQTANGKMIFNPVLNVDICICPGMIIKTKRYGILTVIKGRGIYSMRNLSNTALHTGRSHSLNEGNNFQQKDIIFLQGNHIPTISIDFTNMGIGGLYNQMSALVRQVLISRIIDPKMREDYAVKDIKGILLYGPPGTGKTLIARKIGTIIPGSIITKINGPELLSKFYGESEANIRKIFDTAKSQPKNLHIVIFDEIDSIGKRRGNGSNSGLDDKVLTQLLTMIDGLESTPNVLIIGITNRKDVLDDALIRAGRLEFHLEIPLPDLAGRKDILDIYIKPLIARELIGNIDTAKWAKILDGFSGADIESFIGRIKNLALLRNCDIVDNSIKPNLALSNSKIAEPDFDIVLTEFSPTFAKVNNYMKHYIDNFPISTTDSFTFLTENLAEIDNYHFKIPFIVELDAHNENRIEICHAIIPLNVVYTSYISYDQFLGKSSINNCDYLEDAYAKCIQAKNSVIILDSIAEINDHALNLKVKFLLDKPLPSGCRLVIVILQ